jgi:hypothetical protein
MNVTSNPHGEPDGGPHRPEAFAACRFAIDTLKQQVPIAWQA